MKTAVYTIFSTLLVSPASAPVGTSYAPGIGPRVPPGGMIDTSTSARAEGITPVLRKSFAMDCAIVAGGASDT